MTPYKTYGPPFTEQTSGPPLSPRQASTDPDKSPAQNSLSSLMSLYGLVSFAQRLCEITDKLMNRSTGDWDTLLYGFVLPHPAAKHVAFRNGVSDRVTIDALTCLTDN